MKAQDLLVLLNPYADGANLLGSVRLLSADGTSIPICVSKGLTAGKLRYALNNLKPDVEITANVKLVDAFGTVLSVICTPTDGDDERDLMAELDSLLDNFEEPMEMSYESDLDPNSLDNIDLCDDYMTPEKIAEWDAERLQGYINMNGDRNPVTLDFVVTSLSLPQNNESFMRAIFNAAADAGYTMTYTPPTSYCGMGFYANGCQIKLVDGNGFFGYYDKGGDWYSDYVIEYTDGRRLSARKLAEDYPQQAMEEIGFGGDTTYDRIITVLHDINPDTTNAELHERIGVAVNSKIVRLKDEISWHKMHRKNRKGVQCRLLLDDNELLHYQIAFQYATNSGGKRGKTPVCYHVYEIHGSGRDEFEWTIGTFDSEEAAKDAAYTAYLVFYPGAVGRFAPRM